MVTKKHLRRRQRQKILRFGVPFFALLLCLLVGLLAGSALNKPSSSRNLVWAADETVNLPKDLTAFLQTQTRCEHYRGNDSPTGVALWGVYQVSHNSFAKIAYGCSWNLTTYMMAIKQDNTWRLLPTAEYFAPFKEGADSPSGALPYCSVLDKYKIPKDTESFCINQDGNAKSNEL